jgi:hypothetical protein
VGERLFLGLWRSCWTGRTVVALVAMDMCPSRSDSWGIKLGMGGAECLTAETTWVRWKLVERGGVFSGVVRREGPSIRVRWGLPSEAETSRARWRLQRRGGYHLGVVYCCIMWIFDLITEGLPVAGGRRTCELSTLVQPPSYCHCLNSHCSLRHCYFQKTQSGYWCCNHIQLYRSNLLRVMALFLSTCKHSTS